MPTHSIALSSAIDGLVRMAPPSWLGEACAVIRSWEKKSSTAECIASLPITPNGDLADQLNSVVRLAQGLVSWESLSVSIEVCASVRSRWESEQQIELLWSGPSPASELPARRIDQILYDLANSATREILLVTFAAYRVKLLTEALSSAVSRGVSVRLVLEFETASKGQLSMDAVKAFPWELISKADIFYWPLKARGLNEFGKPGKLHAKIAVVDNHALLSSANLTDDAFNRNLEIGTLISGGEIPERLRNHFGALISSATLVRWSPE
jgi:cardiolipin synthase A/B